MQILQLQTMRQSHLADNSHSQANTAQRSGFNTLFAHPFEGEKQHSIGVGF